MAEHGSRRILAENVRVLRLMRGWSQEYLAEAASLDRAYVGSIERAERNVGIDILDKLAKAFSVAVDQLLREQDMDTLGRHILRVRSPAADDGVQEPPRMVYITRGHLVRSSLRAH